MLESHQVLASALETFPNRLVLSPQNYHCLASTLKPAMLKCLTGCVGRGGGWVSLLLKVSLFPPGHIACRSVILQLVICY